MVIEIEDLQTGHGIDCSHNVYQHRILGGAMDANESLDVGEDKLTRIELRGIGDKKKHANIRCKQKSIEEGSNFARIMNDSIVQHKGIASHQR